MKIELGTNVLAALLAATLVTPALGKGPLRYPCPERIKTEQTAASPGQPFRTYLDRPDGGNRLVYINLYDGPPEERANLIPDNTDSDQSAVWTLAPNAERAYWMVCIYQNTWAKLARPLPRGLKYCRVQTDSQGREPVGLSCTE
jgi:hypothetical protein